MPEFKRELPEDAVAFLTEQTGQSPRPLIQNFVTNWENRETRDNAVRLAKRFYTVYQDALFPYLAALRRGELVDLVTRYRGEGKDDERAIVDMWLMARFPPARIMGVMRVD